MNTTNPKEARAAEAGLICALFVGMCVMSGTLLAADNAGAGKTSDGKPPPLEKKTDAGTDEFNNWVDLSVGGAFVDGDKAQFMRRQQIPAGASGGVSDLHLEQRVGTNGTLKVDGRGIFDNHDYMLKVELADPNKGYLRAGYREFRTWYDGSGGYYPKNKQWLDVYNDELHIDRGEAWIEGGLTLPDWPEISFKFTHQTRDGKKDSTIWGDTALTGLPGTSTNTRGIVPTFLGIDEDRNIFQADVKHTIGKTDLGLGFRADFVDNSDSRNIHRRPGEVPPLVPAPGLDRYVTQKDEFSSDMYNVHAFSETRLSEKVLFTTGYSFTTMDTDIGGTRIYGPDYDPVYDPTFARRQARDEGFTNLSGGLELKQHVANLNLMFEPAQNFVVVPSLRFEKQDRDGVADFTQTSWDTARNATSEELMNHTERGYLDVTESLEARYTGIRNWTLYTRGEWLEGQGDLKESQGQSEPENVAPLITRKTDDNRFTQKYVIGANWYPLQRLNLAGQYYYKARENDYDHGLDSNFYRPPANTGDLYPAFIRNLDFQTHDMNFRVSWHPLSSLTLVSRYDFQLSTIDMRGDTNNTGVELSKIQSAEMYSHIFSESVSWNPLARLFLQASVNYVIDRSETPANDLAGGATKLVLKSKNDYWNASVTAGYALDDKTDLQATYIYYRADDFSDNSAYSQPYGAGAEEHGVTASLSRQMTKNVRWTLRYGFFSNRDELAGGHNNYDAHVVSTTVQYRF